MSLTNDTTDGRRYLTIRGGSKYGGNKTYALTDKVGFYQTDMEKKWAINQSNFYMYIGGEYTAQQLLEMSDDKFLQVVIRDAGIAGLCNHMLRDLHETLAKCFVVLTVRWVREHPEEAKLLGFQELPPDSETFPHNYTDAMRRIKLFRFRGYTSEGIKGYCPFEPLERLKQLLTYPIELFVEDLPDMSRIVSRVKPPEDIQWSYTRVPNNPAQELHNRVRACYPLLKRWNTYYTDLCQNLKNAIEELQKLVPVEEYKF